MPALRRAKRRTSVNLLYVTGAKSVNRQWRLGSLMSAIAVCVALIGGCAPAARVSLVQPQLTGLQHNLQLESDEVYWARSGAVNRMLAEFPLPGARTGRPTYLLYLRWPAGAKSASATAKARKDRLRGFMIQTRGTYAGLVHVTEGQITVRGASQSADGKRRILLDLKCEDGSEVEGAVTASHDDYFVSYFETHRRPADVQALIQAQSQTAATKPKP